MKKTIVTVILCMICTASALAMRPRAVGIRGGIMGADVSYQHEIGRNSFLQGDLSMDLGYAASGDLGFKATGIYNFIFARPAWSYRGSWALYAGPGVSLGYVEDRVTYEELDNYLVRDYGFMLSFVFQIGFEYTFRAPFHIGVDLRPYVGMHINDGVRINGVRYGSQVEYYGNGWFGFVPSVSFRYRF